LFIFAAASMGALALHPACSTHSHWFKALAAAASMGALHPACSTHSHWFKAIAAAASMEDKQ